MNKDGTNEFLIPETMKAWVLGKFQLARAAQPVAGRRPG